jgi:acetolactate synthase-1/3 small subunit
MSKREAALSIVVNNKPDVLARIAGTFSGRGFNIESISANVTRDPAITKIIITTIGSEDTITKIEKQINRLVDVLVARDISVDEAVQREMLLIRMKPAAADRNDLYKAIITNGWKIIGQDDTYLFIEVTGEREDIDRALAVLEPLGMEDFSRTGTVVIERRGT